MRIILASSNSGKIKEIKQMYSSAEVIAYTDILEPFEIEETGSSFKENAIIKAQAVYDRLNDKSAIVIADDSGISVEALEWEPNIFSARYAGINANSKDNLDKMIKNLKAKNVSSSNAFYTACIAIMTQDTIQTTHGWMYGTVIDEIRGDNGFGYDPIFIPDGYHLTLGELDDDIKEKLSHRYKALELAKLIIESM